MKGKGYLGLTKIRRGKRIREVTPGSKRTGTVLSRPKSEGNGWFTIRWDGERKTSAAHANWFYTSAQLRKHGLA